MDTGMVAADLAGEVRAADSPGEAASAVSVAEAPAVEVQAAVGKR